MGIIFTNNHYINSTLIMLYINSSEDHYTHPIEAQDDGTNGLLIIPKPPKRHWQQVLKYTTHSVIMLYNICLFFVFV